MFQLTSDVSIDCQDRPLASESIPDPWYTGDFEKPIDVFKRAVRKLVRTFRKE